MLTTRNAKQAKKVTKVTIEEQKHLENTKIPLVERNSHTGWPLLRVSLFVPDVSKEKETTYGYMLSGGKCHYFKIAGFFFAKLLTQVKGQVEIKLNSGSAMTNQEFNVYNIEKLLDGYTVKHKKLNIL